MNDIDEKIDVYKGREYIVAKSNFLVQKSRYELSVSEQRAICYICSLIKPQTVSNEGKKSPFKLEYEFDILRYAKICGISADNGRIYEETKSLLKGLITKVIWITLPDGSETTVNWVNKVWTNKRSGKARIRIDEDMAPYLFDLQEKFVAYGLQNILAMKSQYSIRLFELFKSYAFQKSKTFDIDELRKLLMVQNIKSYTNFKDFRKYVLEIAINEINALTDIKVSYETLRYGRKVVKLKFKIKVKTPVERMLASSTVNGKLAN